MNTKPNRDITAEEPTTSTEWAEELYKVFYDATYKARSREYIKRYDRIKDFIENLLTTRTNELIDEIEGILNPLWKGRLSYSNKYRYENMDKGFLIEDLKEIEGVVTKLVLYLTKHYHEKK